MGSQVIGFRLDMRNPREAQALAILAAKQEAGFSTRQILLEALLKLDETEAQTDFGRQLEQMAIDLSQICDQLVHLQANGPRSVPDLAQKHAVLSDAFMMSVKDATRPGLRLDG